MHPSTTIDRDTLLLWHILETCRPYNIDWAGVSERMNARIPTVRHSFNRLREAIEEKLLEDTKENIDTEAITSSSNSKTKNTGIHDEEDAISIVESPVAEKYKDKIANKHRGKDVKNPISSNWVPQTPKRRGRPPKRTEVAKDDQEAVEPTEQPRFTSRAGPSMAQTVLKGQENGKRHNLRTWKRKSSYTEGQDSDNSPRVNTGKKVKEESREDSEVFANYIKAFDEAMAEGAPVEDDDKREE